MDYKELASLLASARSYRRFDEGYDVSEEQLKKIIDLVRFCPSGRNLQPMKYMIVRSVEERAAIFPALAWAGYFSDWAGPEPGERPAAYIIQCLDRSLTTNCLCDDGLQLEAITLGIASLGLGSCIIKSFNKEIISEALSIPDNMEIRYVVALGKPAEKVHIEEMKDNEFKYWRDNSGEHHVPKRPLSELIIPRV